MISEPAQGLSDRAAVTELDLGPYRLGSTEDAFGVRTRHDEGYAGGYGVFETLSFFWLNGDTLFPVLEVPIAVQKMTAAAWNADGSRQHDLCQADLRVTTGARSGKWPNLVLRSVGARAGREYRWLAADRVYACR